MEYKRPHTRYDEFAEQFTLVMYQHWSDILQMINGQSPRIASLLRLAIPSGFKRTNGVWRVQVMTKRAVRHDKLHQPRDNEIVARAIQLYFHHTAQLKLPRIIVEFEV